MASNVRRKELDFDKFKMTPWKKFKRKVADALNFKKKGGLWVYVPSLIVYPIFIALVAYGVYNIGVKTAPRDETDNLRVYSVRRDAEFANDLVDYLDPVSVDLKETFDVSFRNPVEIMIHRNMSVYGKNVYNLQPRWPQSHSLFVTSEPGNIQLLSPSSDDAASMSFYNTSFILRNAKISLAQDYLNDINWNFKELPMWLSEGLPFYLVAGDKDINHIKNVIAATPTPSATVMKMDLLRSNLYSIRTDAYTAENGREYAYAFAEFFVEKFGEDQVVDWAKDLHFNFSMTGYESYDDLYAEIEVFINDKYR